MAVVNFRSTTYFKAFLLYAFISAIIAHLAIMLHVNLNERSTLFNFINPLTPEKGISHTHQFLIGTLISFIIGFLIYNIMYFLFPSHIIHKNKRNHSDHHYLYSPCL